MLRLGEPFDTVGFGPNRRENCQLATDILGWPYKATGIGARLGMLRLYQQ